MASNAKSQAKSFPSLAHRACAFVLVEHSPSGLPFYRAANKRSKATVREALKVAQIKIDQQLAERGRCATRQTTAAAALPPTATARPPPATAALTTAPLRPPARSVLNPQESEAGFIAT